MHMCKSRFLFISYSTASTVDNYSLESALSHLHHCSFSQQGKLKPAITLKNIRADTN